MSLFFFASGALSRACCPSRTLPAPYRVWKLQRLKILRCSVWSQSPIISARRPRFRKTLHSRRCAASGEKKKVKHWRANYKEKHSEDTRETIPSKANRELPAPPQLQLAQINFLCVAGWRHPFLFAIRLLWRHWPCILCVLRAEKKHLAATASFWGQRSSNSAPALLFSIMWMSDKVNTALWHLKNSSSPPGIVRGVAQAAAAETLSAYPQESLLTIRTLFVCARGGSACFHWGRSLLVSLLNPLFKPHSSGDLQISLKAPGANNFNCFYGRQSFLSNRVLCEFVSMGLF